jgi:hypothetical protein
MGVSRPRAPLGARYMHLHLSLASGGIAHEAVSRHPPISLYTMIPVPGATRTTLGFGICISFKGHCRACQTLVLRFATFSSLYAPGPPFPLARGLTGAGGRVCPPVGCHQLP